MPRPQAGDDLEGGARIVPGRAATDSGQKAAGPGLQERGRTDEEVLAIGEEVDRLLNLYEQMKKKFDT